MEERVGPLIFTSNFDSGNLARVERVKAEGNISATDDVDNSSIVLVPDYEYNVWTAPDCAGTEHENSNRTWFHFGVKGGQPGKLLRINIMNLNRQGKLYSQGMAPMVKVLHGKHKWERIRDRPTFEMIDGQFRLSFTYRFPDQRNGTYYFAFCYPHSYTECQAKLQQLDQKFESCQDLSPHSPSSSIYYKRELLCYSLDGLRVDILTVTSCKGMLAQREDRLPRLFPDVSSPRVHRFQGKKVFFLSARVHPGETPASLVFNGFLDFVLRSDDSRAAAARDRYIFKLIPLLNPDGVKRGHYRTDARGVNLNRVYIDPDPFLHPSIFAAKSVIMYHHAKGRPTRDVSCSCEKCPINDESPGDIADEGRNCLQESSQSGHNVSGGRCNGADPLNEQREATVDLPEFFKPSSSPDFDSTRLELESVTSGPADDKINKDHRTSRGICSNLETLELKEDVNKSTQIEDRTAQFKLNVDVTNTSGFPEKQPTNTGGGEVRTPQSEEVSRDSSSEIIASKKRVCQCTRAAEPESGIAYYVDLHGHASKRGCFVYANYLENEEDYICTILFPKLVSLNSSHFDFTACNFTEKNMYTRDKRDGMSKEGSGRVAIFKATGIIHSYTLECNYNCGRTANALAAATCDNGRATPPPPPGFPPKYTVEMYEEVGRALVVAALDMKNCNPWTRLPLSEFGSVEGVKNWVRRFVRSAKNAPIVPRKLSRIITRTSSLVAGATGCARQKIGNFLTSNSSSDMSSDNATPLSHKSAHKPQSTSSKPQSTSSLSKPDGTSCSRASHQSDSCCRDSTNKASSSAGKKPPPADLKPPRRVAALVTARRSTHCRLGTRPKTIGASKGATDQEPSLVSDPTRSQLYKNKEQRRVSVELPKTTLHGPVLRMMKHQTLPPAVKTLSRPVGVKVSTVNVQDHLLGFQPKKRSNDASQSDEEKKNKNKRKRASRPRKRSNGGKEYPLEDLKKTAVSCDTLVFNSEKKSSCSAIPNKPTEKQTRSSFMPKRINSKKLLGCTVMSCEVVDITELPRSPQDGSTPLAYWVDA